MTSKHTQGPWSFDPEDKSIVGKDEGLSIATIDNIDVGGDKGFHFGDESEANARLIAAAPELLEALRGLDEAYCRAGTHLTREERTEDRKRLIAARAAIAKATGQPHD